MRVTNQDVADRLRATHAGRIDSLCINDVELAYDQIRDEAGNPQRIPASSGVRGGGFARGVGEDRAERILALLETSQED